MNLSTSTADPASLDVDLLVFGIGSDLTGLDMVATSDALDLRAWAEANDFSGAAGSSLTLPPTAGAARAHVLVGIGSGKPNQIALAAAQAGRVARSLGAQTVAASLQGEPAAIVEHLLAGNYRYERYKPESSRKPSITDLTLLNQGAVSDRSAVLARWQSHCRDLVNAPAADIYPQSLADWVLTHLADLPGVKVDVWGEDKLREEGCVGVLAVGQGSVRPPRMIHVSYRPDGARGHIGLVGKGVTFDSGGLSIKPSAGMQTMRCDMGGSATVIATLGAIAELGVPINLDLFVGAAENMVDGNSFKLGDVLTYANGVTVEIHNTDAEGRLVLADALIHASRVEGMTHLVDAATLTGACVVALGGDFTALFTDSDEFAAELSAAAEKAGEGFWRLPLHAPYKDMLKAEWAQIKNVGGRAAGSTTAALFLQHFVDGPTWAHLDIAGSAFHDKDSKRYAAGATGEPVRTLVEWIASRTQG